MVSGLPKEISECRARKKNLSTTEFVPSNKIKLQHNEYRKSPQQRL